MVPTPASPAAAPAVTTATTATGVERPRIAVLRARSGIGDLLCAVPALRAIRRSHPAAQVTLVGLSGAAWFVNRFPGLVDDLLPVDGVPGLPGVDPGPDPERALGVLAEAQARRFDIAFQLHGSGATSNVVLTLLGASRQFAARRSGDWAPPGIVVPYAADQPEITRLLAVTVAAGCPPVGDHLELPVRSTEQTVATALLGEAGLQPGTFACLHPGVGWPGERCAAVGDHLALLGMAVVLTGTDGEHDVVRRVADRMQWRHAAVDMCDRTSVGTLAALYAAARLVVTADTGASQVAAAVGVPSVVVFGPPSARADALRWAPLDTDRHRRVLPPPDAGAGADGEPTWPEPNATIAAIDDQLARPLATTPTPTPAPTP
jgi:ADP-heptose:LPS heptosyltransferase